MTQDAAAQPGSVAVDQTAALTQKVTSLSVGCAGLLIALKLAAWWFSHSIAMLASLADSSLDLLAALATFFAVRYAAVPPDAGHRYGHGKAEALASLVQAGLVFVSAVWVAREAVMHVLRPEPLDHQGWAMAVLVVSTLVTVALVMAQTKVLRGAASVAVSGDRAHYAADIATNLIALAGVAAATVLGLPVIDALAGLAVALWLFAAAVGVFRSSALQLLDHELPSDARERIKALAGDDPAVLHIHELRTRASGPYVHIQMHAALPPDMTLEEAHRVIIAAENRVLEAFPAADILIHADPAGQAEPHNGPFAEQPDDDEAHSG